MAKHPARIRFGQTSDYQDCLIEAEKGGDTSIYISIPERMRDTPLIVRLPQKSAVALIADLAESLMPSGLEQSDLNAAIEKKREAEEQIARIISKARNSN